MIEFEKLRKIDNLLDAGIYSISVSSAVPSNNRIVIIVEMEDYRRQYAYSAFYDDGKWWYAYRNNILEVNESCMWMESPFLYIEE